MDTRLTGLNSIKNDDEDRLPDTLLPGDESQSQSSSSTPNKSSFDTWAFLIPCQSQLDQHDPYHNNNRKPLDIFCLIKNEYTAGRLEHVDIQFNEENTDLKRLLQTSKTQFIIKRERVTNYKTADYEGDFVIFIYDKSMNGTYINKKKLKNNKGILLHNDTISIAKPDYKVFEYLQSTKLVDMPPELAKNYVALRVLGYGIYGPVTLIYSKTDYCPLALKCSRTNSIDERAYQDNFMNEVDILKGLKHPNVIKIVHEINTESEICIMLEFMQGGKLFDRITKNGGLSEKLTKFYFYQIATAVEYLHDKGITHRHLKLENILLLDNDEYTLVKLTDFGFSERINHEVKIKKFHSTSYYDAPEILKNEEKTQYTSQVDVWSLGVMLYVMLSGCLPFTKRGNKDLLDVIREGTYDFTPDIFKNISVEAKNLIDKMLTVNLNDRYTAPRVLSSSWLDDTELMEKISQTLKPHINIDNNDNDKIKSQNFDRGIGSK